MRGPELRVADVRVDAVEGSTFLSSSVPVRTVIRQAPRSIDSDRSTCVDPCVIPGGVTPGGVILGVDSQSRLYPINELQGVVFRVLARYPEAYEAVREAL